ncbi:MAG: dacB [Crocinitomicaceae bacterium]|jgi:D-alanyl-D-alanine carboxypeptidase/D-alanyl-D-alanine-endopeptidase (penicillin-binding protein 4)|nr:dacB [Crocinitomicaceae bacterium]
MKNLGMKIQSLLVYIVFSLNFIFVPLFAQEVVQPVLTPLEEAKNQFVQDPWLQNASLAICIVDLKTNQKVISHNERIALPPASTVKLFATASAFEMLGANYKPKTRVYYDNKLDENGTLKGNLWVRGGGDISLGSKFYNAEGTEDSFLEQWADTLYQMGLRRIEGNVIGDGSEFGYQGIPDGWNWADMGNYYGAGPAGLPIYDNVLRFYIKVGGKVGTKATLLRIFPEIKDLNFNNYIEASTAKGDNSYIYGAPYSYDRFGTGYLQRNASFTVRGTLPDPELQFVQELKRIFTLRGIIITGEAKGVRNMGLGPASLRYEAKIKALDHEGRSVNSIAWWTNKKSVNVFAEQLVCWIAKEKGGFGDTKSGIYWIERYWSSRIKDGGLNLKDGSGLSRSNAVTAENFCSLLEYMHQSKNASLFKETLAVTGESGTFSELCYGQTAHGRVKGKSGTMNKIKAYAGYVETINGKELAFSIIVNNYGCTTKGMIERIEKLLNAMAKY